MLRSLSILREMLYLIRRHRLYVLAATFLVLAVVAFIVYQVTPVTVITFIYAGI